MNWFSPECHTAHHLSSIPIVGLPRPAHTIAFVRLVYAAAATLPLMPFTILSPEMPVHPVFSREFFLYAVTAFQFAFATGYPSLLFHCFVLPVVWFIPDIFDFRHDFRHLHCSPVRPLARFNHYCLYRLICRRLNRLLIAHHTSMSCSYHSLFWFIAAAVPFYSLTDLTRWSYTFTAMPPALTPMPVCLLIFASCLCRAIHCPSPTYRPCPRCFDIVHAHVDDMLLSSPFLFYSPFTPFASSASCPSLRWSSSLRDLI